MTTQTQQAQDKLAELATIKATRSHMTGRRGSPSAPITAEIIDLERFAEQQLRTIAQWLQVPPARPGTKPVTIAQTIIDTGIGHQFGETLAIKEMAESITAAVSEYIARTTGHNDGTLYLTTGRLLNLLKKSGHPCTRGKLEHLHNAGKTTAFHTGSGTAWRAMEVVQLIAEEQQAEAEAEAESVEQ